MDTSPLNLEISACNMASRLRRDSDDIVSRLKLACPADSRVRTASEMRAVARSLHLAAEHIVSNADALEADHAG